MLCPLAQGASWFKKNCLLFRFLHMLVCLWLIVRDGCWFKDECLVDSNYTKLVRSLRWQWQMIEIFEDNSSQLDRNQWSIGPFSHTMGCCSWLFISSFLHLAHPFQELFFWRRPKKSPTRSVVSLWSSHTLLMLYPVFTISMNHYIVIPTSCASVLKMGSICVVPKADCSSNWGNIV